jgi:hypothetical protein
MVSQTCCHHADFRDLHSIVVLVRIFVVGSVFSGPMALAIDLADLLIAWAAPSSIRRKTGLPLMAHFGHRAMSAVSPLCAQKRTLTKRGEMISYSTARQVVSSRPSSVLRRDRKRDVGGQRNYSQVYCINFSEL